MKGTNGRPGSVIHAMVRFAELRSAWRRSFGRALHESTPVVNAPDTGREPTGENGGAKCRCSAGCSSWER